MYTTNVVQAERAVLLLVCLRAFLVQSSVHYVERMQQLWVNGQLSTYHYLDFLNCLGGRSKSDYSAYPVFPWTIMR